jgi:hypothetical protein
MYREEAKPMLYEVLKDFQAGIVGILGFAGVIITLSGTDYYARAQRDEQRHRDQVSLQTALRQELVSIMEELQNIQEGAQSKEPFQFTLRRAYVYETLVKDIGILPPEQVKEVIRVHRDLYLLMQMIRDQADDSKAPVATLLPEHFAKVSEYLRPAIAEAQDGIDLLPDVSPKPQAK